VASSGADRQAPYHHGNLRYALIEAATELAREGGPSAIVLREAARRVGVSANAAYRHFTSLPDLVAAVAEYALAALARSMEAELAACPQTGDPGTDAVRRLNAVGRGYIHFALAEPGLFATAFGQHKAAGDASVHSGEAPALGLGASGLGPYALLERALDDMVEVGVLDPADRTIAATNAWASVHGLSNLLLGPLAGNAATARESLIDAFLDLVARGLITR
jgi:AcrR family transcriptional regulator